jgi:predicted glycosyltransferase
VLYGPPQKATELKIIYYCQHVLGLGHFFRALEICRALEGHEVLLVSGGPRLQTALPGHLRLVRLPALRMNREFQGLGGESPLAEIKSERRRQLTALFAREAPELFLVELYPFGRKAFRFELDPVLEGIRRGSLPSAAVVCSLRDILVEREDLEKYEARIIDTLNRLFDALLIHADPSVFTLEETFTRCRDIAVPIVYTGFVTPRPAPGARAELRRRLGIGEAETLVVASAGGGKVGAPLLNAAVRARGLPPLKPEVHLHVFTGPYMDDDDHARIAAHAGPRIVVRRFSDNFTDTLAAADLSVSMGGYDTRMNILAAGVPALVWPFGLNREQRMRAERLAGLAPITVLDDADLDPARLAGIMGRALNHRRRALGGIDLDGARHTADWIARFSAVRGEKAPVP